MSGRFLLERLILLAKTSRDDKILVNTLRFMYGNETLCMIMKTLDALDARKMLY